MKTRITLTVDAKLLHAARVLAIAEGRSLNDLLVDQLAIVVRERRGFAQARDRALARLCEGIDLGWTPARSRHNVHER
jgi:hypothetical protein